MHYDSDIRSFNRVVFLTWSCRLRLRGKQRVKTTCSHRFAQRIYEQDILWYKVTKIAIRKNLKSQDVVLNIFKLMSTPNSWLILHHLLLPFTEVQIVIIELKGASKTNRIFYFGKVTSVSKDKAFLINAIKSLCNVLKSSLEPLLCKCTRFSRMDIKITISKHLKCKTVHLKVKAVSSFIPYVWRMYNERYISLSTKQRVFALKEKAILWKKLWCSSCQILKVPVACLR